jgi:hypothetical protein
MAKCTAAGQQFLGSSRYVSFAANLSAAADVISLLGQVDYVNAYLRLCANDVMP